MRISPTPERIPQPPNKACSDHETPTERQIRVTYDHPRSPGIESAAAIGDITGWLTPDTPLQARIRALTFAADHQRLSVIDQLIDAQTPVNAVDELFGRQALRLAAQNGRTQSVRRLLEHGADPNLRDAHGHTALDLCQPGRRYLDNQGHDEVDAILRPFTAER